MNNVYKTKDLKEAKIQKDFQNMLNGNSSLPHSPEAEKHIIGGLIMNPQLFSKVNNIIKKDHFYLEKYQIVYSVIEKLLEKIDNFDVVAIYEEIKRLDKQELVTKKFLFDTFRSVHANANIEKHALVVLERSMERDVIKINSETCQSIAQKEDIFDVTYKAIHNLERIVDIKTNNHYTPSELAVAVKEDIEKRMDKNIEIDRLYTGWTQIDNFLGGIENGDMTIIAGRPSMGKTHVVKQLTYFWSIENNIPGAYISLEMKPNQSAYRHIQIETGITPEKIKQGEITTEESVKINAYLSKLHNSQYFVDMMPGMTISELKFRAKELKKRYNIKYLIIDHIGLMHADQPMNDKRVEMSYISNAIKKVGMDLDIKIFPLVQLNRSTISNKESRPDMSNLKESGTLEEDADSIIFIHRPEYYGIESFKYKGKEYSSEGVTEMILAKNRQGNGLGSSFLKSTDTTRRLRPIDFLAEDSYLPNNSAYDVADGYGSDDRGAF